MGFVVILILIILGFVAYKAYSKTHGVGTSPVSKTSAESNTAAASDSIPEHSTVTSKTARSSVGSVLSSMAKSLAISGSIIAACIAVMLINQALGIILMMLYSSYMVIKSSRKEMPLNKFTALLPGVMSILTFLIMLALIDLKDPIMPIIGMGLGIVVGFLMARGHKVYTKGGVVYAKRTIFYFAAWALSMLFTQGSTLAGMREITSFGFLLNGFSTAMLVVLSIMLFFKIYDTRNVVAASNMASSFIFIIFATLSLSIISTSQLQAEGRTFTPKPLGKKLDHKVAPLMYTAKEIKDKKKLQKYQSVFQNRSNGGTAQQSGVNTLTPIKRNRPRRPPGRTLMDLATPVTDPKKIKQYQDTFLNRNNGRTEKQKQTAQKYFGFGDNLVIPKPDPSLTPVPSPFPDSTSSFEFSDEEAAAGALLAILMLLSGVGMNAAASTAMSGAMTAAQEAANSAMTAEAENTSSDNGQEIPVLFDPDFGDELPVQDGSYEGGEIGQVWYDGQWLDQDEAAQQVADRKQEIDRENREREEYLDNFQKQNEREWQQKMADRDQRLRDEHNVHDDDQQAWVRDPNYTPPRTDLEEFYDRVNYLDDHSHELSDGKNEAIDRILDRIGYEDGVMDEEKLSKEDMEIIKKLTKSVSDTRQGNSLFEQADAEHDAAEAQFGEDVSKNVKKVGKISAEVVEKHYTKDWTKGGITEFVFSVAGNHDKDIWDNLEESGLSTLKTVSGNLTGDLSKDSAGWRVFNNAAWAGGEEAYKGGDAKKIAQAALENVLAGEAKEVFGGAIKNEEVEGKMAELLKKPIGVLKNEAAIEKFSKLGQDSLNRFGTSSSILDAIETD